MTDKEIKITLTEEEADLLIKALDGYRYITSYVWSYNEPREQKAVVDSILDQLPHRLFLKGVWNCMESI